MFVSDTQWLIVWCMFWVWIMYACMLIVCVVVFPVIDSNDELRRRERSLNIKKKEIRDKPLKASHLLVAYLNSTITLCIAYSCFLKLCIVFLYCYYSLDSNSWRLSSTSRLDIIHRDDTSCDLFNTPLIRDLMVSIKVFGKLVVEPKTLGLGLLSGKISKMFSKTLE
jgi:hypothetical protein